MNRPDIEAIREQARGWRGKIFETHIPALCEYWLAIEDAFLLYAMHLSTCAVRDFQLDENDQPVKFACDCGLDELKAAIEAARKGK